MCSSRTVDTSFASKMWKGSPMGYSPNFYFCNQRRLMYRNSLLSTINPTTHISLSLLCIFLNF